MASPSITGDIFKLREHPKLCVTTSNRKLCEGPRLIAVPNGKNTHKYIIGDINKLKELISIFIDEKQNLQQDNPQPSSKIDTFILEKVQRLDGNGQM